MFRNPRGVIRADSTEVAERSRTSFEGTYARRKR